MRSKGVTVPLIRRMAALSGEGLSDAAVARVVCLDYRGVELDAGGVRYYRRTYGFGVRESWLGQAGLAKDASGNLPRVGP